MKTKIGNITAELKINADGTTECFINKGSKSASLDCAIQEGEWSSDFTPISKEDAGNIDKIYDWAISNGY